MASKKTPVRDARFKDRERTSKRPSDAPRTSNAGASRGASGKGSLPREVLAVPPGAPPWRNANLVIPVVLGLILVGVGVWFYRDQHPPASPATNGSSADGGSVDAGMAVPAADASAPTTDAAVPARDVADEPETAVAVAPTGTDDSHLNGEPLEPPPGRREATSPDPRHGHFTLAEATAGLAGTGALVAEIETSLGTFTCDLLSSEAPNTVANFVGLARGTRDFWDPMAGAWARRPFYDGSIFHRVIPDFMIQGGDQLRSGSGGTGYEFADENVRGHDAAGQLCMANHGPNTNGGQFFITQGPKPHLDGTYSIFGHCRPPELVGQIVRVHTQGDRPLTPVFIRHVRVSHTG